MPLARGDSERMPPSSKLSVFLRSLPCPIPDMHRFIQTAARGGKTALLSGRLHSPLAFDG